MYYHRGNFREELLGKMDPEDGVVRGPAVPQ